MNADTLTGSIQNSETLNRFSYANGNPINFIDPFGRSSEPGSINYKGKNTQAGFLAGFDYFNYILAHRGTSFLYSGIYANWTGAPYQISFYGGEIGALFMSVAGEIFGGEGIGAEETAEASDIAEEAGGASKPLYRVMGEGELNAVKETGMLRGGREGTTYFTDSYFRNANVAQARLALPEKPDYIMEFEIANNPSISGGTKVLPNYGQIGGGREYFTDDSVYVNINNYQKMIQ